MADRVRSDAALAEAREALAAGRIAEARARSEEAVALNPSSAEAHALLGEVLYRQGSLGGALHEMTTALRHDPHNAALEKRLRELREEQDLALAPLLRDLKEPEFPSRDPLFIPRPRLPRVGTPEWARAVALIGGTMLLIALAPRLVASASAALGVVVGVLIAFFVYRDARASGMSQPAILGWTALVFVSSFLGGWYGLLALLAYLLVTRARR